MPPPMFGKLNLAAVGSGGGWGVGEVFAELPPHEEQLKKKRDVKVNYAKGDVAHDSDEDDVMMESIDNKGGNANQTGDVSGSGAGSPDATASGADTPILSVTEPSSSMPPLAPTTSSNALKASPSAGSLKGRSGRAGHKQTPSTVSDDTIVDNGSDVGDRDAAAHMIEEPRKSGNVITAANLGVSSGGSSSPQPVPNNTAPRVPPMLPPMGALPQGGVSGAPGSGPDGDADSSAASSAWPPGEIVSCVKLNEPVKATAVEGKELWVAEGNKDVMSYTLSGCALTPSRAIPNVNNVTSLVVVPALPKQKAVAGFRGSRSESLVRGSSAGGTASASSTASKSTSESAMLWCGLENGKIKVCNLFFATVEYLLEGHHSRVHFMFMAPGPRNTHRVWSCSDSTNKVFTIWDAAQCKQVYRDTVAAAICDATVVPASATGQKDATIWTVSHFDPHYKVYDLEGRCLKTSQKFQGMGIRAIRYHAETKTVWMCIEHQVLIVSASNYSVLSRLNTTSPVLEFVSGPSTTESSAILVAHGGTLQENEDRIVRVATNDFSKGPPTITHTGALLPGISVAGLRCISPVMKLFVAAHKFDDKERYLSVFTTQETPVMDNWGVGESALFNVPKATKKSSENEVAMKQQATADWNKSQNNRIAAVQARSTSPQPDKGRGTSPKQNNLLTPNSHGNHKPPVPYLQHVPDLTPENDGTVPSGQSSNATRITHRTDELSHHAIESATRNVRPPLLPLGGANSANPDSITPVNRIGGGDARNPVSPNLRGGAGGGHQRSNSMNEAIQAQIAENQGKVHTQLTDIQKGMKQLLVTKPANEDFAELYRIAQKIVSDESEAEKRQSGAEKGTTSTKPSSPSTADSSDVDLDESPLVLESLTQQEQETAHDSMLTSEGKLIASTIMQLIKTVKSGKSVKDAATEENERNNNAAKASSSAASGKKNEESAANTADIMSTEAILKVLQQQNRTTSDERAHHQREMAAMRRQYDALRDKNDTLREELSKLNDDMRRRVSELQRDPYVDSQASEQLIREFSSVRDISRTSTCSEIRQSMTHLRRVNEGLVSVKATAAANAVAGSNMSAGNTDVVQLNYDTTHPANMNASTHSIETPRESARSTATATGGQRSARTPVGHKASSSFHRTTSGSGSVVVPTTRSVATITRSIHIMKVSERRNLLSIIVTPRIEKIENFANERALDEIQRMSRRRQASHTAKLEKLNDMAEADEPRIVTLRRLQSIDFCTNETSEDLELVWMMINLCDQESSSVISGAILGEIIEVLSSELEVTSPDGATGPLFISGGGQTAAGGTASSLAAPAADRTGSSTPLTHDNISSRASSFHGHPDTRPNGAVGGSNTNSPIAQLLHEAEALDKRFGEASVELENVAGKLRSEVANLVMRPDGPKGALADPTEISAIPRKTRATMAKLNGFLYWCSLWFHLLVKGLEESEAALQSPNLTPTNEDIIRGALGSWCEIADKIKRMLVETKEAMNKLRNASSGGNTQSASSMVPAVLASAAEAAAASDASTPKGGVHGASSARGNHAREASFNASAVSFIDSADTIDAIARESAITGFTSPAVTAILVYFNIVAQGQAPTLVAASPSSTPALLDATPSKTSTGTGRDRANSSSPPGSAANRALSPSSSMMGDKALTDHFDDIFMAVEKLLLKLEKMETCTVKLFKSIDAHPEQHELRSAELRPFVKDFVRMKSEDF